MLAHFFIAIPFFLQKFQDLFFAVLISQERNGTRIRYICALPRLADHPRLQYRSLLDTFEQVDRNREGAHHLLLFICGAGKTLIGAGYKRHVRPLRIMLYCDLKS